VAMKQKELPLRDQKFRWKIVLCSNQNEEGTMVIEEAYTESQALFLAAKRIRKKYKKEHCLIKKIGTVS